MGCGNFTDWGLSPTGLVLAVSPACSMGVLARACFLSSTLEHRHGASFPCRVSVWPSVILPHLQRQQNVAPGGLSHSLQLQDYTWRSLPDFCLDFPQESPGQQVWNRWQAPWDPSRVAGCSPTPTPCLCSGISKHLHACPSCLSCPLCWPGSGWPHGPPAVRGFQLISLTCGFLSPALPFYSQPPTFMDSKWTPSATDPKHS